MNIRVLLTFAAIAAVVVLSAGLASATPVALINPLFQDPATGTWPGPPATAPWDSVPDGQTTNEPSGWQTVNGVNADTNMVEYNPTSADFTSAAGDNGVLPSPLGVVAQVYTTGGVLVGQTNTLYGASKPTLGSQALYNVSTTDNDCAILSNDANDPSPFNTITLQPNKGYTVTVAIGQGLVNSLGYYAGFGLVVAEDGPQKSGSIITTEVHDSGQDIPDAGTFYDYSVSFNSNDFITTTGTGKQAKSNAGDKLRFGINLGSGSYCTDFRVDIGAPFVIPEPSTLALLASGLIGLLAYAWRKRK